MSFSRLNYDPCTYQHNLKQSVGAADYYLGTPLINCRSCFPSDPNVNLGFSHPGPVQNGVGGASCTDKPLVDVASELRGITRKASNCPTDQFRPGTSTFCKVDKLKDCTAIPNESTRLSNPSCSLRCTGWNRWEWLCTDPQSKSLMPFDYNINNRLIVKDNHRPCIQTPINQASALPPANDSDEMFSMGKPCEQPFVDVPSIHWRKCSEYDQYKMI